jgi:hypothetical protein
MKHDRFLKILRSLHFENNEIPVDRMSPDYDRLWKLRRVFSQFTNIYSTMYHSTKYLAVDEVTVKYKGRVGFQQYIPRRQKRFGIKLYKLHDNKVYTYDMVVYLGEQCANAAENVTPTHRTVLQLTRRVEGVRHKLLWIIIFHHLYSFQFYIKGK